MAAFEAVERLQKFDWLIQKLHSLRSTLQSEQGLQELQKLHALQLLQRNGVQFNGSSIGESEEDKMEMCKMDGDEDEQEDIEDEPEEIDEDTEIMDEDDENENENEENDERPRPLSLATSTEEMLPLQSCLPLLASNGSHASNRPLSPAQFSANLKNETSVDSELVKENFEESDSVVHESQNGFSGPRYGRFPTGLFPPLPFDTMLGDESDLKVGNLF
jgi:hypothetical protein